MTFLELQDDALERLDHSTSGSTAARTRIKRFINKTYRRLCARPGIAEFLRYSTTTIPVVASTKTYTVTAAKVRNIYDTTNQVNLVPLASIDSIRALDPGETLTGIPTNYVLVQRTSTTWSVRLWPTPSANATLQVDIEAAITELSADGDIPIIPQAFHDLLSLGARIEEYELKDDSRRRAAIEEFEFGVRELRTDLARGRQEVIKPGRMERTGVSRLGSYYPAD